MDGKFNKLFETALEIAVKAHKGQVDKNGVAYITHPLAVAAQFDSLLLKTIAILHDTIEDTDVTAEYLIECGISEEVVRVIQLLTKPIDEDYESYLKRVREDPVAKVVKLADLAHNTDPKRGSGLNEKRKAKYKLAKKILSEYKKCPKCGGKLLEIIYGLPDFVLEEACKSGEVEMMELGGDDLPEIPPGYRCNKCGLEYLELEYPEGIISVADYKRQYRW